MKRIHHRDSDRALLQYIVAKTPAEDGVLFFHLTEIYQSPAGVDHHVEQAQDWDRHVAWVEWLDKCRVARTFDGVVRHTLW
jgi:quinol monooxygenase YgiN